MGRSYRRSYPLKLGRELVRILHQVGHAQRRAVRGGCDSIHIDMEDASSEHGVARAADGRWLSGVSPNPGGRPKGPSIVGAILRNLTEADADEIAKAWIRDARRGRFRQQARDSLADRTDGRVPTQIGGVIDADGDEKPIPIRLLGP